MSNNPPSATPPSDYELMVGSIFAFLEDGIPHKSLFDLTVIAQTAKEFEAWMNASVELGDILDDQLTDEDIERLDQEEINFNPSVIEGAT